MLARIASDWARRVMVVGLRALGVVVLIGLLPIGLAAAASGTPGMIDAPATSVTWTQQFPTTSPPARHDFGMAYDPRSRMVLLYGGAGMQTGYLLTWAWDGTNWASHRTSAAPNVLSAPSMEYDAATRQLIYFGGNGEPCNPICTPHNETWNWTGRTWVQLFPATSPPARSGARIVYDASRRTLVLFGGSIGASGGEEFLNDTWTWDGTNWTQQLPATSPPGRYYHHLAHDPIRQQTVLFGGVGSGDVIVGDTWTWDGTNWTQQFPTPSPAARTDGAMAFDPTTRTVVLFGGDLKEDGNQTLNDTWSWTGTTWQQLFPTTSPSPRWSGSMVYDVATNALVLFGGSTGSPSTGQLLNETWTLQ